VGPKSRGAIFNSFLRIPEIATTVFSQAVQGAIAENTAERIGICAGMAGKIFTLAMLEKIVVWHILSS